jgi:hypothetical protein
MENVTVHTIPITKKGEWKYFQVRLPKDAKKIIGIETGLIITDELPADTEVASDIVVMQRSSLISIDPGLIAEPPKNFEDGKRFGIERNRLMGELKLQSLDTANIFYTKDIVEEDRNIGNDAIRIINNTPPAERRMAFLKVDPPPDLWQPMFPFTHGCKLEEDGLLMLHNPVIAGIYKDAIGKAYNLDINYKVMLYIWHDS